VHVPPLDLAPRMTDGFLDGHPVRVIASANHIGARNYVVVAALPMGPANDALRRFGWILGALVPGVLGVAGLGGAWISRRALAPVDRLTRDVQALTVRSLDRRLDVPAADDEIRRLATTFNDMLGRLEAGVADMARFTADAAHELRTPVTLVRTTADVTLSRDRTDTEYRQAMTEVQKLSEQMSTLVGDLLVLARADAGVEPDAKASVDLASVAQDAVTAAAPTARLALLSINLDATPGVTTIGNASSLRRLLIILIDNAIRYTPGGGAVQVRVAREHLANPGVRSVIEVMDTGLGIDPADRSRVFDRFYRGANAREKVADGAGLGLSIAQTIVRRHDGTISVDAGPDGRGCCVRVELPAST
jgi:signal transduction histidine kinase